MPERVARAVRFGGGVVRVAEMAMSIDFSSRDLRDLFASTMVGELTLKAFPILSPSQTVADAAAAMREHGRGSTLVCDAGKLVGIFTERDWMRVLAEGDAPSAVLSARMTPDPECVTVSDSVGTAVGRMDDGGYRRVPVLDDNGVPIGILDVRAIVHFIVEQIPAAVYNQASHAALTAKRREGA